MEPSLRLLALARDQVALAETMLAAADQAAWAGPAAHAYRERLDQRREACAVLRAEVEEAYAQALASVRAAA